MPEMERACMVPRPDAAIQEEMMSEHPVSLGRYDKFRVQVLRANMEGDTSDMVGGDTRRWEIVGIAADHAGSGLIFLGHVRSGIQVASSQ